MQCSSSTGFWGLTCWEFWRNQLTHVANSSENNTDFQSFLRNTKGNSTSSLPVTNRMSSSQPQIWIKADTSSIWNVVARPNAMKGCQLNHCHNLCDFKCAKTYTVRGNFCISAELLALKHFHDVISTFSQRCMLFPLSLCNRWKLQ